jgi:hypothetical protein
VFLIASEVLHENPESKLYLFASPPMAATDNSSFDLLLVRGQGSVVGIVTGYGLDGPEIESR